MQVTRLLASISLAAVLGGCGFILYGCDDSTGVPIDGDAGPSVDGGVGTGDGGADSGTDCGSLSVCDGACVDTGSDPGNCGGCGTTCDVAGGDATCTSGACAIASCEAPNEDCDGAYANGCEVDTATDSDNCGACVTACTTDTGECADSACLTGRICIHAGEMRTTPTMGPGGPVYAMVCSMCTGGDFSMCPRYELCSSYSAPQCGGCITGFADWAYTVEVFVDLDSNADPMNPLPDAGDLLSEDRVMWPACQTSTISGGGTGTPSPVSFFTRIVAP